MRTPVKWMVVENAGYEGERDVYTGTSVNDCHSWMEATYSCIEVQELHVDICQVFEDGDRLFEY